ncbi:putative membrane protein [Chlamydia ibidis 10-1398/6]|uniref:Membrane protein n=2 Tax=Chlamydia ibidis TaxID=1405396 RepID=A0ABP2XDR5_9CHLA|nr:putative membrane protein [Chlamydia ibidis 10-1398/6]
MSPKKHMLTLVSALALSILAIVGMVTLAFICSGHLVLSGYVLGIHKYVFTPLLLGAALIALSLSVSCFRTSSRFSM